MSKAKGVPQHVLDKLEAPELPEGYYWRLDFKYLFGTKNPRVSIVKIRRRWFDSVEEDDWVIAPNYAKDQTWESMFNYLIKFVYTSWYSRNESRIALERLWSE